MGNLPLDIGVFVGREAELERASKLLGVVRLLTLTGPGGVGKTRLALHVAHRFQTSVHDDTWMIDLGTLRDPAGCTPERVYAHMAHAMGIRHHGSPGLDALLDRLRTRRVLLVLDNCEALVPATRACVTALLSAAPDLRILATSRQPLGADGEQTLLVPPLSLPDAMELFTTRAIQAGADAAALTDTGAIRALCHRLDRLPLAIRLAAGRIRTLSTGQLLERLDDRFHLLTEAAPLCAGSFKRHSTLQEAVTLSHGLCTESEQRLWARASVFTRSFDLAAAEAVCGGDGIDPADVVDIVAGLVDKSVLTVDLTVGPRRYTMLETLRDYGFRELAAAGETARARARHCDYYRNLVAHAAATWLGPTELDTMSAVYRDLPDVLVAVDESVSGRDLRTARAICQDLVRIRAPFFWRFLDPVSQRLHAVLAASAADPVTDAADAADRSATMAAAAFVAIAQGRRETWRTLLAAAHNLLEQWGLEPDGPVLYAEGVGASLGLGELRSIELLATARAAFTGPRQAGDRHMATMAWAMATAFLGDPADAVTAGAENLRQAEQAEAPGAVSWALWTVALAALRSGDHHRATECVARALREQKAMGDHWGQTWSIELCAWIITARLDRTGNRNGEAQRAAWLLGAARARQDRLSVSMAGLKPMADARTHCHARLVAELGELKVAEAMAAGMRGHKNAVGVAIREPTPNRPSAAGAAGGLTRREREIADLIAKGLTSGQIGVQLHIQSGTVDVHVSRIMRKLDVHSRAALAVWAATHTH